MHQWLEFEGNQEWVFEQPIVQCFDLPANERGPYMSACCLHHNARTSYMRSGYFTCPPHLPYTTPASGYNAVLRITSIIHDDWLHTRAYVVSAHEPNYTQLLRLDELVPVKGWSRPEIKLPESSLVPDGHRFIDPFLVGATDNTLYMPSMKDMRTVRPKKCRSP
jgi:hypothetical protein